MDVFLARQPIFNSSQNAHAYEILYRSGYTNSFSGVEADEASSKVIIDTFQSFGIKNLTSGKPAFINFSENLIKEQIAMLFPNDTLVIEVLETVNPDESIIEKCKLLKKRGYTIALDDFVYKPEYEALIDFADIIKIDFIVSSRSEIEKTVSRLKNRPLVFLAEKVETHEEFEYAKKLGFSLFQGFFFSRPEILTTSRLSPLKANYLQLVSKVNQLEINFDEIAVIISRDLSLTYNLLRLVNSAAFGLRKKINSVKHAIVIIGEKDIKKWVTLIALIGMGQDKPDEVVRLSLIRARFAELISQMTKYKNRSDDLFLTGLFSLLDVVLNKPLSEILKDVNAPQDVKNALLNKSGDFGSIYKIILFYEKGLWENFKTQTDLLNIDYREVIDAYLNALLWYNKLTQDMQTPTVSKT